MKTHRVSCSVCGKKGRIVVGKPLYNWYYFNKIDVNCCKTSKYFIQYPPEHLLEEKYAKRVVNECFDPKVKPNMVEYWECKDCYEEKEEE